MKKILCNDYRCPTGLLFPTDSKLPSIKIYFLHYDTFENALLKWNERKKRINWSNIYVINNVTYLGEYNEINDCVIGDFNKIPYKKVIISNKKSGFGFDNEFYIKCDGSELFKKSKLGWKRTFNKYNFNKFFNSKT